MTALEKLFGVPEKKSTKTTKTTKTKSKPKAEVKSKSKPKENQVICSVCGEPVWKFQQNDGVCKKCQKAGNKVKPKPKAKAEVKSAKAEVKSAKAEVKSAKTEGQKRGLKSKQWHDKEATFKQTSFLRKVTGLKTWGLEKPISRYEASELIAAVKDDDSNIPQVTAILQDKFGCEVYVPKKSKSKSKAEVKLTYKDGRTETNKPESKVKAEADVLKEMLAMMASMKQEIEELKNAS